VLTCFSAVWMRGYYATKRNFSYRAFFTYFQVKCCIGLQTARLVALVRRRGGLGDSSGAAAAVMEAIAVLACGSATARSAVGAANESGHCNLQVHLLFFVLIPPNQHLRMLLSSARG
jgi:hypothetical protein